MTADFKNNTAQNRYEYHTDGHTAFANYHIQNDILYIDYVEAPQELRGTGAAGRLMQHVADTARQENRKMIPVCGYAAAWLRKHPEFNELMA